MTAGIVVQTAIFVRSFPVSLGACQHKKLGNTEATPLDIPGVVGTLDLQSNCSFPGGTLKPGFSS